MQLIIDKKNIVNNYLKDYNFQYNEYGKPYVDEFYFNKSHSDEISCLIIDNKDCGIDIEKVKKYNELMASKIFSSDENRFLSGKMDKDFYFTLLWTLKESYLKAVGCGISVKLSDISFVNNDKLLFKYNGYKLRVIRVCDYIISTCRKD